MVTDNEVIQFVSSEKRGSLTIERRTAGNQTPNAPPRFTLTGEWGSPCMPSRGEATRQRNVLVDFGYTPEALLTNISILKIDPSTFDALVLSHGHFDHFGGMVGFLAANKGTLKKNLPLFVGGEDCFCTRETILNDGQFGALDRKAIADAKLSLMVAEGPAVVADHALTRAKFR